jgi:hypothetical protein
MARTFLRVTVYLPAISVSKQNGKMAWLLVWSQHVTALVMTRRGMGSRLGCGVTNHVVHTCPPARPPLEVFLCGVRREDPRTPLTPPR